MVSQIKLTLLAVFRAEFIKAGVLTSVFNALDAVDVKVQAAACLCLSRLLQEGFKVILTVR